MLSRIFQKSPGRIALTGAMLLGFVPLLGAGTIRDDEASRQFLATEIAASSGAPMDGYERYSRKLAKTLSSLTPEQQARILEGATPAGGTGFLDNGGDGEGEFTEEEIADMQAFEEFFMGGESSGWNGESTPWWWDLLQSIFQEWMDQRG